MADGEILFNKLNVVVARYLGVPLEYLGAVPQDKMLAAAVMQQKPVSLAHPNAESAKAYRMIAEKLEGLETTGNVKKRGMAAFFSHIVVNKKNV